jgi:hypothetical protein
VLPAPGPPGVLGVLPALSALGAPGVLPALSALGANGVEVPPLFLEEQLGSHHLIQRRHTGPSAPRGGLRLHSV